MIIFGKFYQRWRSKKEIKRYHDWIESIVWLRRALYQSSDEINEEPKRKAEMNHLMITLPPETYQSGSVWEDGYYAGILAGVRWVMGCAEDFIDT